MKRKVTLLLVLLLVSLSTVAFLTVKYVHTVRLFNQFYETAKETASMIDSETAELQAEIISLQQNIDALNSQLDSVTAERDALALQVSASP